MECMNMHFDYCTLIGSCLLLLPIGVHIFWSNMSVYVTSYFYRDSDTTMGYQFSLVISLVLINRCGVLLIIEAIVGVIGIRAVVLGGIALFNIGIATSYYTVGMSAAMLDVTVGGVCGFGAALLNAVVLKCVLVQYKKAVGVVVGIVQSSYPIGAIFITEFVTLYINPLNKVPEKKISDDVILFGQPDVLARVPYSFLIICCSSLAVQLTGFALFRNVLSTSKGCLLLSSKNSSERERLTGSDLKESQSSRDTSASTTSEVTTLEENASTEAKEFSPGQVLCSRAFCVMWIVNVFHQYPYLMVANYYKSYGQLWIKNDHLLANLATVMSASSVLIRMLNGWIIDRFGVKNNLAGLLALTALSVIFFFTSIMINQWFYFVVVALFMGLSSALTSSFAVATVKHFGKKRLMVNFGLITSSSLLMLLVAPPLMEVTLVNCGWFALATQAGAVSTFNSIIVTIFFPM